MKVVLVARDIAPSMAFARLRDELLKRGVTVKEFLGNGKPLTATIEEIRSEARSASAVLCGMSSSEQLAKEEIYAADDAASFGIPYGFYCDTYGCHRRPWFKDVIGKSSFLFHINMNEARDARDLCDNEPLFDVVHATGNPMWEDFCFPRYTREEVREKLGVNADERMILVPGSKILVTNMMLLGALVEATHHIFGSNGMTYWRVFFSQHPGDPYGPEIYSDVVKFSKRVPVRIVPKDVLTASEMIPGCDVVVQSASTTGIEAAHQRKPVLEYLPELVLARNETLFGTRKWELCELGVACDVLVDFDIPADSLADAISEYTRGCSLLHSEMLDRQEEVFPAPAERGTAVKKMADVIMSMK